jgi:hypothetical protein
MTESGKFNDMTVLLSNGVNGENSDYTIEFKASIPVYKDDIFYFVLPPTIKSPRTPLCEAVKCLDSYSCTAEKGRIVITLGVSPSCEEIDSIISFKLIGIKNSISMVPNEKIGAFYQSKKYH